MVSKLFFGLLIGFIATLFASKASLIERQKAFEDAKYEIEKLREANPEAKFELNKFAFMTEAEKSQFQGLMLTSEETADIELATYDPLSDGDIPESYNYRDHDQVTSVKAQGGCGACYVFASTAAVESQYIIHGGQNLSFDLSEEYAMECDTADGECAGGNPIHVYGVFKDSGVPKEECDKYTAQPGTCPNTTCQLYKIAGYRSFGKDETKFAALLYKYGPATVAIDGTPLRMYYGGVLSSNEHCNTTVGSANHAVLLVGYTPDTWIFKNSWGPYMGEDGYFRVKRGMNWCGMAVTEVLTPYLKN